MMNGHENIRALVFTGALGLWVVASGAAAVAQGQPPQDQDIEIQTRGPVHEAFADLVTFDAEPGLEIPREPPPGIEEIPPDQRPEGNEAFWIPGYWAFDDDRNDFLWVSGVWRIPPPAHTWVPGYWHRSGSGWRWVQGFWSPNQAAEAAEITYLAPPPENLEAGPSSPPPSDGHLWTPGSWSWRESRYAWQPGCWIVSEPEWVWVPARYQWTPGGHVFIEGHWDHLVDRRGVLYAPVYFRRPVSTYVGYHYTPSIAIDLGVFSFHLFSRPRYNHYYFGDYYAPAHWDHGIYPTFAFHNSVYGYDPFHQHRRWEHRRDEAHWEASIHASFYNYRENEHARPRHTYEAQQVSLSVRGDDRREDIVLARPVKELPAQKGSKIRLEPVPEDDRRRIAASDKQQIRATQERGKIESEVASRKSGGKDHGSKPEKVKLPKAAPVARAESKNRPPAPPERPKADETGKAGPARETKGEAPAAGGKDPATPDRKPDVAPGGRESGKPTPERQGEKPERGRPPDTAPPATPPGGKPGTRPPEGKPEPRPADPRSEPAPRTRPPEGAPPKSEPKAPGEGRKPESPATAPKPEGRPGQPGHENPPPRRRPEPQLPKKGEKPAGKEGEKKGDNPPAKEGEKKGDKPPGKEGGKKGDQPPAKEEDTPKPKKPKQGSGG